jgi:hypothetical protein
VNRKKTIRINLIPKKRPLTKGWAKALRRRVPRFLLHISLIEYLSLAALVTVVVGIIVISNHFNSTPIISTEGCEFGQAMELSNYTEGHPSTVTVLGPDKKKIQFFIHEMTPNSEAHDSYLNGQEMICIVISNTNPGLVYIFPREE